MKKALLILLVIIVLSANIVFGAISSTSLPKNEETNMRELRLHRGEEGTIYLFPTNEENTTIDFIVDIRDGKQYLVSELKDRYEVPPYSKGEDVKISLTFKAPENATVGDKYRVEYSMALTTHKDREEGIVSIAPPGFIKKFDIVVLEDIEVKRTIPRYYYYIGIGVLAIIVTILLTYWRKKTLILPEKFDI